MIKSFLDKGELEIVVGNRYVVEGDDNKFEAHIYLKRGNEMHGGIGKTAQDALFEALLHWRRDEGKKEPAG